MNSDKAPISVYVASLVLTAYCIALVADAPFEITALIFFIFPATVVWMVFSILRAKSGHERELAPDEEWGYADKPRETDRS